MSKTFTLMRARQRDRRHLLRGAVAAAGAAMLTGCDRLSQQRGVRRHAEERAAPEPRRRRRSSRRAGRWRRSSSRRDVAPVFRSNGTLNPGDADYVALRNGGFAGYKLSRRRPGREAGRVHARRAARDAVAHPDHAPRLRRGLELHRQVEGRAARAASSTRSSRKPEAKFVVFRCFDSMDGPSLDGRDSRYYESIDLDDAQHAQTILAYDLNDKPLPVSNGAPLRCRVERQLGYKQAKYVRAIELVASFAEIRGGKGGYWEDEGYEWYGGI